MVPGKEETVVQATVFGLLENLFTKSLDSTTFIEFSQGAQNGQLLFLHIATK